MVQYTPPPPTLDHLNPIQRYMQKGQLEKQDWIALVIFVAFYFTVRPYIQKAAKWWMAPKEGEQIQKDYEERRAKAKISANSIRGGKETEIKDEAISDENAVTSGSNMDKGQAVNRKSKGQSTTNKSEAEKLLDWDDEPARTDAGVEKADVAQWLDKWDE